MANLLSLAEAQERVLASVCPLAAEDVPVAESAGRFLAEDAFAAIDLPPFASSAMDGFAVRSADTPGTLPVVARIAAGVPAPRPLEAGEAMAIATGGVVPGGADAVIPLEYVVDYDNSIEIADSVVQMANVRPQGGDVRKGQVVVSRGIRLRPLHIGALSAAGIRRVRCGLRPRVFVVATGTELRTPGEPLEPGQVYEANATMLAAALASAGAQTEVMPSIPDDAENHRGALERALAADVVVTSGGVSVGPHDLVRRTLGELGVHEVFWRVAVKPGKPISFATRERTLVFGLPGNPVSSLVGCELFVLPAVQALQGASVPGPFYHRGRLATPVRRNGQRDEFVRARRRTDDDGVVLDPIRGQESHMIARAATADSLVFVPRGEGEIAAGESVRYLLLD